MSVCRPRRPCASIASASRSERRLDAYKRYFDRLRKANAQDPELRKGLRLLGIDGSAQLTSLTCPKVDRETGEVINAHRVTCPEGGYAGMLCWRCDASGRRIPVSRRRHAGPVRP